MSLKKADVVVLTEIIRQVLSVDKVYADKRAAWDDKTTPSDEGGYIAWRRKLLSKLGRSGKLQVTTQADRRGDYLRYRAQLLATRFRPPQAAAAPAIAAPRSPTKPISQQTTSERFAFAGMHHIFGEQKSAVTIVKFANETKDLLAFGCDDGTISVCTVVTHPYRVALLKGHFGPITDFDWGITNDFIVSTSQDKTVRVWQSSCGLCTRNMAEPQVCWCCAFLPLNNNLFVVGTKRPTGKGGLVKVINVSTGLCAGTGSTEATVRAVCLDNEGNFLWSGDESGTITTFRVKQNGALQGLCRKKFGTPIWSLEFKGWYHQGKYRPMILASAKDGSLKVLGVANSPPGEIFFDRQLPCVNSKNLVRASFCPLLATQQTVCVVTGGQDGVIRIYDLGKRDTKPINQLAGHGGTVHDVAWSYDETLLASCDSLGMVYIWKRVLNVL